LIAVEDREIRTGALGDYKPLSWYERQGYDIKAIEEKCDDTTIHKVLGTCYRVEFVGGGETWKKRTRQTDELHGEEDLEGTNVLGNSASSSLSRASAAATAAAQQTAAEKEKMTNFKKQMAELQKTEQKHEGEAQKVLKEVSGELSIVAQLVKSKQFKCLEKNYTAVAEGLIESHRKLGSMKQEALECIAEGSPCVSTEKLAREVVKSCVVQRQFVYKIIRETP
jgi:Neuraminidase (sialidase)